MKLQRYDFRATDVMLGECDDGDFVRHEDYAALEAEKESLRAKLARYENEGTTHAEDCWAWGPKHYECALTEIKRLKAPPKVLEPEQVTKDGAYWFRRKGGTAWVVKNVFPRLGADDGSYIGPLPPPEV